MTATAALIATLAEQVRPVKPGSGVGDLVIGVTGGAIVTLACVIVLYGIQPGLAGAALPAMLMKDAFGLSLAALALATVVALGRPAAEPPNGALAWVPVAALALAGLVLLSRAPGRDVPAMLLGGSWSRCPIRIALLSLPTLAGVMLALRRRAPTCLRRAGAAAGMLAGGMTAALYALACAERSPAFVAIWYSLGIAAVTALGALLGPRLLRW